jgi:hypothetical protein
MALAGVLFKTILVKSSPFAAIAGCLALPKVLRFGSRSSTTTRLSETLCSVSSVVKSASKPECS